MKKYTVAYLTKILGNTMKSRMEVIEAKDEEEAKNIYTAKYERMIKLNGSKNIVVEEYRW